MPYKHRKDLPDSVKDSLPEHGQEIYLAAFNSAYDQYDEPHERKGGRDREETAHSVAWAAVKNKYRRASEGHWVPKEDD